MSNYYLNYNQYLGAQRCCIQGNTGPMGPTGPASIGAVGATGPRGESFTGPTGKGCKGDTGPRGPAGQSIAILGGLATNLNDRFTSYFGAFGGSFSLDATLTEINATSFIPYNCTISDFYIILDNGPGTGITTTFTIRKNNADTSVSTNLSNSTKTASNISNSVIFNAGDTFTISCTPSSVSTTTSVRWSCKITAS